MNLTEPIRARANAAIAAGHRSNEVAFSITIRAGEAPRATTPEPTLNRNLEGLTPAR